MRSKKALLNAMFGLMGYAVFMVSNFITRSVFVDQLGLSMAGIDSTFKNLLAVLSLAELGLGTGLIYKLYQPIEQKDNAAINRILNFYKQAYKVIAAVFLIGGAIMASVVHFFIKEKTYNPYFLALLFVLYAGDTVASYLFANRKALITADQRNYLVSRNDAAVSLLSLIAQVTFLYLTKSFIVFAVVKIICRLIGATLIGHKFKQLYPEIAANKSKESISGEERRSLLKNMSAMLCHRIGGVSVTATGTAIISSVIGTVMAGIYGNYVMITNTLAMMVTQVFYGITASFGNLMTVESKETIYKRFNMLYFLNFLIYCFCTVSVTVLIQPFMLLWIGKESLFTMRTVILLLCYFYVFGIRRVILMSKDSAGLFRPDRYMALLEAAINIVLSLILVHKIGVDGLILANLISMLVIPMWTQPYLVYKYILKHKLSVYYLKYIIYAAVTVGSAFVTFKFASFITVGSLLLELFLKVILCLIVPNVINLILFWRTAEMKDLLYLIKNLFSALKAKKT